MKRLKVGQVYKQNQSTGTPDWGDIIRCRITHALPKVAVAVNCATNREYAITRDTVNSFLSNNTQEK